MHVQKKTTNIAKVTYLHSRNKCSRGTSQNCFQENGLDSHYDKMTTNNKDYEMITKGFNIRNALDAYESQHQG